MFEHKYVITFNIQLFNNTVIQKKSTSLTAIANIPCAFPGPPLEIEKQKIGHQSKF